MLLKHEVLQAVINEIEETGDWASLAAALGQYGIDYSTAKDSEILDFTEQIIECEEVSACIYKEGEEPVFKREKKFIKSFVESSLRKSEREKARDFFLLLFDIIEGQGKDS